MVELDVAVRSVKAYLNRPLKRSSEVVALASKRCSCEMKLFTTCTG
jgi:hypothetical protein